MCPMFRVPCETWEGRPTTRLQPRRGRHNLAQSVSPGVTKEHPTTLPHGRRVGFVEGHGFSRAEKASIPTEAPIRRNCTRTEAALPYPAAAKR